jgi:hypothetical protein
METANFARVHAGMVAAFVASAAVSAKSVTTTSTDARGKRARSGHHELVSRNCFCFALVETHEVQKGTPAFIQTQRGLVES